VHGNLLQSGPACPSLGRAMPWRRGCRRCNPNFLPLGPREWVVNAGAALTTILPAIPLAEAIETARIHRVAGLTGDRTTCVTTRPYQRRAR
jgi:hypothetical protein